MRASPSTSLCLIARNESQRLAQCLGPVASLVDETVVVDTGSTDGTKAIAADLGARVFDFPWCDDFAAARNAALNHAKGDWIFWMDADERVDPANLERLAHLLRSERESNAAFLMKQVSVAADGGPHFAVRHVRLFPKREGVQWEGRVHEQIVPGLLQAGVELCETNIELHHYGYLDRGVFQSKIERNLRILELEYEHRKPNGWYLFQRGAALRELGRSSEAIVSLHFALPLVPQDFAPRAYVLLAEVYAAERDLPSALDTVRQGRHSHPDVPDLAVMEARVLAALGDFEAAEQALADAKRAATSVGPPFAVEDRTVTLQRRETLMRVLLAKGEDADAEEEAREMVRARPRYAPGWFALGDCLLCRGAISEFERMVQAVPSTANADLARKVFVAMRLAYQGSYEDALDLLDSAWDPSVVALLELRLRWLTCTRADVTAALDNLLRVDPLNVQAHRVLRATLGRSDV